MAIPVRGLWALMEGEYEKSGKFEGEIDEELESQIVMVRAGHMKEVLVVRYFNNTVGDRIVRYLTDIYRKAGWEVEVVREEYNNNHSSGYSIKINSIVL